MISKKDLLLLKERKTTGILEEWFNGASRTKLQKKYGDYSKAVIFAETNKLRIDYSMYDIEQE